LHEGTLQITTQDRQSDRKIEEEEKGRGRGVYMGLCVGRYVPVVNGSCLVRCSPIITIRATQKKRMSHPVSRSCKAIDMQREGGMERQRKGEIEGGKG
jgi:hypothetical protein